jgi:hypothetical protein
MTAAIALISASIGGSLGALTMALIIGGGQRKSNSND